MIEFITNYNEFVENNQTNPFEVFFHKTSNYADQNEFRIIVFKEHNNLVKEKGLYIMDIGKLDSAQIFEFKDFNDSGMKINIK